MTVRTKTPALLRQFASSTSARDARKWFRSGVVRTVLGGAVFFAPLLASAEWVAPSATSGQPSGASATKPSGAEGIPNPSGSVTSGHAGEVPSTGAGSSPDSAHPGVADSAANSSNPTKVERIEVTGSHIRRVDTEGVAPVQTITRDQLDRQTHNSVSDVLRDQGVSNFGAVREQAGIASSGTAEVNLRGLGADNTLVLLNGQRLPTDAITGAVDLNLIPLPAVERIEILKDGASAIYGSDALGGVVNIITRKDFAGSQIGIQQALPEDKGGKRTDITLVNGVSLEKLNIVTSLAYRYNQSIHSRDRSWTSNNFSPTGDPGSYRTSGDLFHADPKCPRERIIQTGAGEICQFKYSDYSDEIPSTAQIGGMTEANFEASSKVKLNARIGASHRTVKWSYAPSPGSFTLDPAAAARIGAGDQNRLPGTTAGQPLDIKYRLSDLGTRDTVNVSTSFNALVGAKIELSNDWSLTVNVSHNITNGRDKSINGYALQSVLVDEIQSGAYDPFAPAGARGSLESTKYQPIEYTSSRLESADIGASGSVAETANGPIGLAIGTTYNFALYKDQFDQQSIDGKVFGGEGSSGGGHRSVEAVYSEISAPLFTKDLELQVAGRYDHYSDFGGTTNPKGGLIYHASKNWLIRASAGTGFRAPTMQELHAASGQTYPTFIDHLACANERGAGGPTNECKSVQYEVDTSANPNLKQTTSVSYGLGTVYEPHPSVELSVDGYLTQLKNVSGIDFGDMTRAEQDGVDLSPGNTNASHVVTHRSGPFNTLDSVEAPLQSLGERRIVGLDIGAGYRFWKMKLSTQQAQVLSYREEGFPGSGVITKTGWNGLPRWRNTTALNYSLFDNHEIALTALTTSSQQNLNQDGRIGQFTTWDLSYEWKIKQDAKDFGSFVAAIRNVLGRTPPIDLGNDVSPVNYSLYDPNKRVFMVGYKQNF